MQLRTVLIANSIIAFLFGTGFTFNPTLCGTLMGFDVAGDSFLIARGMGVFVIFTGILAFSARNAPASEARRATVFSLFCLYILLIQYKLSLNLFYGIPPNAMFVSIYMIHTALIASYGYFLFGKMGEKESSYESIAPRGQGTY